MADPTKDAVVHLGHVRRLSTYTRDDRGALESVVEGLSDLTGTVEAVLIQEKYGVSVVFHEETLEWEAYDPVRRYSARGNTPSAAVYMWDGQRQKFEEKKRPHSSEG